MVVGQASAEGGQDPTTAVVPSRLSRDEQMPTTAIHSPPTAGGILIDYWAREFIHSCWSGDTPEAHEFRQRRTSPTTAREASDQKKALKIPPEAGRRRAI